MIEQGHEAEITPEGDRFLVTCPHRCKLGTSAHADTREQAERRVALHRTATEPLTAGRNGR